MKTLITLFTFALTLSAWSVDTRPNIIFLLTDDQQANALGCMGNDYVLTPNLDKLASQGVLFERAYSTTPICMAARATAFTGMYEYKTGCNFQTGNLSEDDWTNLSYAVLLKQAGYRTGFAGKWGFGISNRFDPSGTFDAFGRLEGGQGEYETAKNPLMAEYASEYPHVTRALGAFGRDFIKESVASGQPFCLSISYKAPHEPHDQIDPKDQWLYEGVKFPKPAGYGNEGLKALPPQAKLGRQYMHRYKWGADSFQEHQRAYYQLVSGVDASVAMLVDALEEAGVADNTVIIYTSDNGYFCGAHGLAGKVMPYERAIRIPLIVKDPRAPKESQGRRTAAIVANIDFAPTILDLAGLTVPEKMDGESLVPSIQDPEHRVRTHLGLIQAWDVADRDMPKALAVVSEDWKYIHWAYGDAHIPVSEELYDMQGDPNESKSVSDNPELAPVLEAMQQQYDAFHQHWADNCVEDFYARYKTIFDRNISWQDKDFVTHPDDEKRLKKWTKMMNDAYEEVSGESYPTRN